MIRILIRQVTDPRPRAPKSMAVADIQPDAAPEPGGLAGQPELHTVTVHLADAAGAGAVFHAHFRPTARPDADIWRFVHEAVAAIVKTVHPSGLAPK